MTVKELEEALGMPRASIRFYEQEGLLSPARSPNGYRDYSPEDVETLKKVKLLRELGVDLETIRALQAGRVTLSQALRDQLARLERDETALAGAREVCARLRGEWVSYGDLDAGAWLERLEDAPSRREEPPSRREKPTPADPFLHPWRRYFARSLDVELWAFALWTLLILGFHMPIRFMLGSNRIWLRLFVGWLANLPMLLLEPFLLSRWGTTPGKALFGIKVLDSEGEKMPLRQARERTWEVFSRGMGYGIPLYDLWRNFQSWRECRDRQWHDWEIFSYTGEPERMTVPEQNWRCVAYVGAQLALMGLAVLVSLQSLMPPCRGDLDLAGFCRNVNFYNRYLSWGEVPFNPEGLREEKPETGVYVLPTSHDYYEEAWSPIEENGETVGFRYTLSARGKGFYSGDAARQLGVLAYAGSMPGTNCFTLDWTDWVTLCLDRGWEFDFVHRGVRLTQTVEYRGEGELQDRTWGWVSTPYGDSDILLKLEFTIRRADTES